MHSILRRPELLAEEIDIFVAKDPRSLQFRADLAGLLVVAMAASYEACVKETLMNFAARHHSKFAIFAQNHFSKLNSRVKISDLYNYARTFDSQINDRFGKLLKTRKNKIQSRIGRDFTAAYAQILSWRHAFAHAGIRNTTVQEALATHRLAKGVIYTFDEAFS